MQRRSRYVPAILAFMLNVSFNVDHSSSTRLNLSTLQGIEDTTSWHWSTSCRIGYNLWNTRHERNTTTTCTWKRFHAK